MRWPNYAECMTHLEQRRPGRMKLPRLHWGRVEGGRMTAPFGQVCLLGQAVESEKDGGGYYSQHYRKESWK